MTADAPSGQRSADPADWPVYVVWTWLPRLGWHSQRHPFSPREVVEEHAEVGRKFFAVECRLPVVVEVRDERDGPPKHDPGADD